MFSESRMSTKPIEADYLVPDNFKYSRTEDYERGGLVLRNPYDGIDLKTWKFFIEDQTFIKLQRIDEDKIYTLFEGNEITEIKGSFDRNMNPCYIYKEGDFYFFLWFDTLSNKNVIEELGTEIKSPRIAHDDKRPIGKSYSDIIITYIKENKVYYRIQADRYQIEYLAFEGDFKDRIIISFGMNKSLRLQWLLDQESKYL